MNTYIIAHMIVPYFCSLYRHLLAWSSPAVLPVPAYYWREARFLLVFSS